PVRLIHSFPTRRSSDLALLDLGMWDGAYYLAGYAVEVALKACIIKAVMATDAFPEKKFSENCWTHDLEKLIVLAGLKAAKTINLDRKSTRLNSSHRTTS